MRYRRFNASGLSCTRCGKGNGKNVKPPPSLTMVLNGGEVCDICVKALYQNEAASQQPKELV